MKDSEIERLDMYDRIKVIGWLETARQMLNSLLGKKGTLEDISVFLGWTETAFKEARAVIRDVIAMENDEE